MTYRARAGLGLFAAGALAGCASGGSDAGGQLPDAAATPDAGPVPSLALSLSRLATASPSPIQVTVKASAARLNIVIDAGEAAVSTVVDNADGTYLAVVTPPWLSGELPIAVSLDAGSTVIVASVTALVLPTVADGWDQPEAVPGLVNTAGYEDGATVSTDGEWLIVSSYSPVDLLCCYLGCGADGGDPFAPACQDSLGPSTAPWRPDFPGVDRILSSTRILNLCPKLCFDVDGGEIVSVPLSPVAAYGFHRQPDDTFAEPFALYVDADGCRAPFGFNLISGSAAPEAEAVVAYNSGSENQITWMPLTLGAPNRLASYACIGGVAQLSGFVGVVLPLSPSGVNRGNPSMGGGYLWFDDEYDAPMPYLAVTTPSGPLPDASFTPAVRVPVADASDDRRQPFLDDGRLYFYRNGAVASAALVGDPALADSWSGLRTELGGESVARPGAIFALGEPTLAHRPDGGVELYFVYAVVTASGTNLNVGRVRGR